MDYPDSYDVIVIGAGHAGSEAAAAAARTGAKTLLLTQAVETIGQMSCNPAIGGIGKSHLVREIDALDGLMAKAADMAGIQLRVLNASKGPAVRATRAQADRALYRQAIRSLLDREENLSIFQQTVVDLLVEERGGRPRVTGVVTQMGLNFRASAVVLTTGTFLGGRIHIGLENHPGGRAGDAPSNQLAERLRALPFRVDRLKTGTPPRIDGRSVDFSVMDEQPGDTPLPLMSFMHEVPSAPGEGPAFERPRQVPCFITQTNERTHGIILSALDRSPLYTGVIEGTGPRYCPSIETRWSASETVSSTRSSWSRKVSPPASSIRTVSPPACPSMCRCSRGAQHPGIRAARTSPGPATPSSTISSIRGIFTIRWKRKRWRVCFSPDRSTARRGTRKPVPRDCWPG